MTNRSLIFHGGTDDSRPEALTQANSLPDLPESAPNEDSPFGRSPRPPKGRILPGDPQGRVIGRNLTLTQTEREPQAVRNILPNPPRHLR